jgi:drug/metabolite transporter (DMT)-like permease
MATLWAVIFLGEWLTWPQIIGGALVIAGVIVLQTREKHTNADLSQGVRKSGNQGIRDQVI